MTHTLVRPHNTMIPASSEPLWIWPILEQVVCFKPALGLIRLTRESARALSSTRSRPSPRFLSRCRTRTGVPEERACY